MTKKALNRINIPPILHCPPLKSEIEFVLKMTKQVKKVTV